MRTIKNYFSNLVHHEFVVPQPIIDWYIDSTEMSIVNHVNVYLFLRIDGCYNEMIQCNVSKNRIHATDTVRESALKRRMIPIEEKEPQLIIHTNTGSPFAGDVYFHSIQMRKNKLRASMSLMNSPTEKGVAERFVPTFQFRRKNWVSKNKMCKNFYNRTSKTKRSIVSSYKKLLQKWLKFISATRK